MDSITWEKIISWLIQLAFFLLASYLFFYKSFLKYMGKQMAELATIDQLTSAQEIIKKDFKEKLAEKIEPLKSALAKDNMAFQIEYAYLHQKRAEALVEIYGNLQKLHAVMIHWTAPIQLIHSDAKKESEDRLNAASKAIEEFGNYYHLNKLLLQKPLCEYIEAIFNDYSSKHWDFGYRKFRIDSKQLSPEDHAAFSKELRKISSEIMDKLPPKLEEIEEYCRKILKVEDSDSID